MRTLVVTATGAELDPLAAALGAAQAALGDLPAWRAGTVDLVVSGVGAAAAAATTAIALHRAAYGLVVSAGIGGGFEPVPVGGLVVASCVVLADLGAETPEGVLSLDDLGLGPAVVPVDPAVTAELARCTGGTPGAILTVNTVTGTAATAARLRARYPDAAAEAMEGAGVQRAGALCHVPFGEIRAISNRVGPRDRSSWRIPEALVALTKAVRALVEQS